MIEIFETRPPKPAAGELMLTVNLERNELAYLAEEDHGRRFFTTDQLGLGVNTMQSIHAVYEAVQLAVPECFTSMAARIQRNSDHEILKSYGDITLVVDDTRVAADYVIFNGDFKNLAFNAQRGNAAWIQLIEGIIPTNLIVSTLDQWDINTRRGEAPRRHGGYFEARLMRAITPEDITRAYIPRGDSDSREFLDSINAQLLS